MENTHINNKSFKGKAVLISLVVIFFVVLSFIIFSPKNIESIKDSVVMIEVYDKYDNQISTGSGFCAYKSNYIVTNFHVIEGAYEIKVVTDENKKYLINDIIIFNEEHDLAILSGGFQFKPIPIGSATRLKAGDTVTTIGSPKGVLNTVSTGIVSNADNDYEIRITAPISPGSSGGVLLNKFHKVIGITYAVSKDNDAQNLNYAISVDYLNKMYDSFKSKEYTTLDGNEYIKSGELTFEEYSRLENFGNKYYSVISLDVWHDFTSIEGKLEYTLSDDWYSIYDSFTNEDKYDINNYIVELQTIDFDSRNITKNIDNWSIPEFFINLDILDVYQYSIVAKDISLCENKDEMFDIIEEYPLEAAEKSLILYLVGNYDWSEIHTDNKEDIFEYFDTQIETDDFGAILEFLGYTVEYKNDGTLTAWW